MEVLVGSCSVAHLRSALLKARRLSARRLQVAGRNPRRLGTGIGTICSDGRCRCHQVSPPLASAMNRALDERRSIAILYEARPVLLAAGSICSAPVAGSFTSMRDMAQRPVAHHLAAARDVGIAGLVGGGRLRGAREQGLTIAQHVTRIGQRRR